MMTCDRRAVGMVDQARTRMDIERPIEQPATPQSASGDEWGFFTDEFQRETATPQAG